MTLLFADSFDLTATADQVLKWNLGNIASGTNGGSIALSTTTPYSSGHSLAEGWINFNTGSGQYLKTALAGSQSTLIVGFAYMGSPIATDGAAFFQFMDGGSNQVYIVPNANGNLQVFRGNGTSLGTGTTVLASNVWYYLELKVVFGTGTNGSIAVNLNGVSEISVSGINTANSGVAQANTLAIGNVGGHTSVPAGTYFFDDFYCCNALGAVNNNFLGPIRVIGLLPNGAGTNTNWTKVGAAASNYQSVNENPPDGDTTRVQSLSVGQIDTYQYADLPANALSVLAVCNAFEIRKDGVGSRTITTRVRSGASEADASGSIALTPSYSIPGQIMEVNPVTSVAWTVADVNGAEFGPKVFS